MLLDYLMDKISLKEGEEEKCRQLNRAVLISMCVTLSVQPHVLVCVLDVSIWVCVGWSLMVCGRCDSEQVSTSFRTRVEHLCFLSALRHRIILLFLPLGHKHCMSGQWRWSTALLEQQDYTDDKSQTVLEWHRQSLCWQLLEQLQWKMTITIQTPSVLCMCKPLHCDSHHFVFFLVILHAPTGWRFSPPWYWRCSPITRAEGQYQHPVALSIPHTCKGYQQARIICLHSVADLHIYLKVWQCQSQTFAVNQLTHKPPALVLILQVSLCVDKTL